MADYKVYGMRLESGEELVQSVQDQFALLPASFCDVSGLGELRRVTLQVGNDEQEQSFEGPLQLIDFKSRLRQAGDVIIADYVCTVSRLTDDGVEVLGGKVKEAEIEFVELSFQPVEMMAAQLPAAPVSRTKPAAAAIPAPVSPPQTAPKTAGASKAQDGPLSDRWAKAVLESRRVQQEADYVDDGAPDERPAQGDVVMHQQFGECKVTRINDDHITLRNPEGRNVQLGISILSFTRTGEKDGKDVFNVEVKTKH